MSRYVASTTDPRPPTQPVKFDDLSRRGKQRLRAGIDSLPNIVDRRTVIAKRYRHLVSQLVADMGGPDNLSEVRMQLLLRFAGAAILAERVETKILKDELVPLDDYSLLIGSCVRVANKLGLDRIPRNLNAPSLRQYLENREPEQPDDDRDED